MRKHSRTSDGKPGRRYVEALGGLVMVGSLAWAFLRPKRSTEAITVGDVHQNRAERDGNFKPQATIEQANDHEGSHIYVPGLVAFLICMAVSAFMLHAGLWGWLKTLRGQSSVDAATAYDYHRNPASPTARGFPVLQVAPQKDWKTFYGEQRRILTSYSWINPTAGVVRVPIDVAMRRIVATGIPQWGSNKSISPLELQQSRAEEPKK